MADDCFRTFLCNNPNLCLSGGATFGTGEQNAVIERTFLVVAILATMVGLSTSIQAQTELDRYSKILDKKMSFDFEEAPFSEVQQWLSENLDINVLLDDSARDDNLSEDDLVTLQISDAPLRTALRVLLDRHHASFQIDHGVLKIISQDDATDPAYFRRQVTDCRKLLSLIAESEKKFPSAKPFNNGGGGNSQGGIFNLQEAETDPSKLEAESEAKSGSDEVDPTKSPLIVVSQINASELLLDTIKSTITPDEWYDTNGDASALMLGGLLVVAGTETQHFEIKTLLQDMESMLKQKD